MKFSMFFIAEYAHVITASALMATLFLGGWDIPFWPGDNFIPHEGALISGFNEAGEAIPARLSVWTTLLTLGAFAVKTTFFVVLYIWVRWTLPRFRYDQVMHLGWKVMLPTALTYVMLVAATILVLDQLGVSSGTGLRAGSHRGKPRGHRDVRPLPRPRPDHHRSRARRPRRAGQTSMNPGESPWPFR